MSVRDSGLILHFRNCRASDVLVCFPIIPLISPGIIQDKEMLLDLKLCDAIFLQAKHGVLHTLIDSDLHPS